MKEVRFFYDPEMNGTLPEEEARHAVKVLRLQAGDEIFLMDGKGVFYRAEITLPGNHRCLYRIVEQMPQQPAWGGHLHLAMAPTKLIERTEWVVEKATEIGMDELSLLDCQFSERRVVKCDRLERILISAMKQSHKAWKPQLNEMTSFKQFVTQKREGDKFICHCYDMADVAADTLEKPLLMNMLCQDVETTVLVGPEGDFSVDEVRLAIENGYQSVSLGRSRLRTETAALVAVHMMQMRNQKEE